MKRLWQGFLIAALVGGLCSAVLLPTAQASIDSLSASGSCSSITATVDYTRFSEGDELIGFSMYVGDFPTMGGYLTSTGVVLPFEPISGQVTVTLNFPEQPEGTHLFLFVAHWVGERLIDQDSYAYECTNVGGPACTEFVPLPKQAVVGQFNWNSEIYWAPGHQIFPMLMVEAGNTYYVAGQDESETYYKVLISCEWVWVRKDTVGPNYDEVWQGTPLPMDIVE